MKPPARASRHATFTGAVLPICGVEVLIVAVTPQILADEHESSLYVAAFSLRFQRTIVLMAQDHARAPTYYGPAAIVRALRRLPFEIIPWKRLLYALPRPRVFRLPIPPEPRSPGESGGDQTCRYDSSIEDLSRTVIRAPQPAHTRGSPDRAARTTRR